MRRRGGVASQQAWIGAAGSLIDLGDWGRRGYWAAVAGRDGGMGSRDGARWAAGAPLVANGPSAFSNSVSVSFSENKDPDSGTSRSARMIAR